MSGIYDVLSILRIPIEWCLVALTNFFHTVGPLRAIGAFGIAIVCTTIIIRGFLFPLYSWQLRTTKKNMENQRLLAPRMAELRKKYRKDPRQLAEEQRRVYAEHGLSPFSGLSGCLPALVQMPVLYGLYRGISDATKSVPNNSLGFLWIPNVSESANTGFQHGGLAANWTLLIIPLLAALGTFVQSRMMAQPLRDDMTDQERSMASVGKNIAFIMPAVIFYFGISFSQGLTLYWLTGTVVMVIQQYYVIGWGSLNVPKWFPGHGRVTDLTPGRQARPAPARAAIVADNNGDNTQEPGNGRAPAGPRPPQGGNGSAREPVVSTPGRGSAPARPRSKQKRRR